MDRKPADQPEQAGCGKHPKSHALRMLVCKSLCNVNDTRSLIGRCFPVLWTKVASALEGLSINGLSSTSSCMRNFHTTRPLNDLLSL